MNSTITVLIADDDLDDRVSLRDTLEAQGFTVLEASNGEDAFLISVRELPDLIILDVGMPPDDGYAVCKRLRLEAPTLSIPVLMLTCHGLVEEKTKGLNSGADDYLVKPCHNDELLARIAALFRRYPPKGQFFERIERARQSIIAAESFRRLVVVLNIDVKGSSALLKDKEEDYNTTLIFRDYHALVDQTVADFMGQKPAWAGDGGTAEFSDCDLAVKCALEILKRCRENERLSQLVLRIGIAAGDELLDPDSDIGKRTSQTHNRAGHFQKHSNYNHVTIGEELFEKIADKLRFKERLRIGEEIVYEAN
jgi:DNA-binding response OmpR family regulator